MNKTQNIIIKKTVVNFFGGLGYFFAALQWLLLCVVYQTALIGFITSTTPAAPAPPPISAPIVDTVPTEPNILATVFGAIFIVGIVMLSIYVLFKAPIAAARTSKKAVQGAARAVAPLVIHAQHKPDTLYQRKRIMTTLIIVFKSIVIIVPLIFLVMSGAWSDGVLDPAIASMFGMWLAGGGVVCFVGQYVLAKMFAVKRQDIS